MRLLLHNLIFEITRKCNMNCDHCLRGPQEPLNMSSKVIKKVLQEVDGFCSLTITGGEPSLNARAITLLVDEIERQRKWPDTFYIVTNGKRYSPAMAKALQRLYENIPYHHLEPVLRLSYDDFHEPIDEANYWRYNEPDFFYREDKLEYNKSRRWVLNEGNAELYGLDGRDPEEVPDYIDVRSDINELYVETDIYINAYGNVLLDCDLSYARQKQFVLGNVLDEPLLQIIERHAVDDTVWLKQRPIIADGFVTANGIAL